MQNDASFLPPVVDAEEEAGRIRLRLGLSGALPCFEGHFPGFPVLPGVVQIHWAIFFAQAKWNIPGKFTRLEQIKFNEIVQPDEALELLLTWQEEHQRIEFEYRVEQARVSSGRIRFQGA